MRRLPCALAACMLVVAAGRDAAATRIEVHFTGRVVSVANDPLIDDPVLAAAVRAGDPVFGRFAYDPAVAVPAQPLSSYAFRDPGFRLELALGDARVSTDPSDPDLRIQILDDWLRSDGVIIDRFGVISMNQTRIFPSSVVPAQLQLFLSDESATAFDSSALPEEPIDPTSFGPDPFLPGGFGHGQVATLTGAPSGVFINFSVETWSVVPEPGTGMLVGLGLAALGSWRRVRAERTEDR